MVTQPSDAPVTRREFYMELMVVWLFILLASLAALRDSQRWSAVILPVGALLMVALHALALRRSLVTPQS
jgi:hypothetical protein